MTNEERIAQHKKMMGLVLKKLNKFIFLIMLGLIFHSASIAKSNLLPLDEYIKNEDIKSFAAKEYVLLRCSANFKLFPVKAYETI